MLQLKERFDIISSSSGQKILQLLHAGSCVQVVDTENDLGLEARDCDLSKLCGFCDELSTCNFEQLTEANYPRLYKSGILVWSALFVEP